MKARSDDAACPALVNPIATVRVRWCAATATSTRANNAAVRTSAG